MASDKHLGLAFLDRLGKGEVSRAEAVKLLLHLQCCQPCYAKFRENFPTQSQALWLQLLDDMHETHTPVDRSMAARMRSKAAEVHSAKSAFDKLREMPSEKHRLIVDNTPALATLAGAQCLLEEARDQWHISPPMALHWSKLALSAIETIPSDRYPVSLLADYTARAWAYVANANRLGMELETARKQLKRAEFWLELGTQEPLEAALLRMLDGFLARDKRCFAVALQHLEQALTLYRASGDTYHAAWLEVELAITNLYAENYEVVIQGLEAFLRYHTASKVGTTVLVAALHCLGLALVECGQLDAATARLREARRLAGRDTDLLVEARFDWLEARILAAGEQAAAAEELFHSVQGTFIVAGAPYDAALVSLDLAEFMLKRGRSREVKELAEDMIALFLDRGIHREAKAAGLMLTHAILEEEVTLSLVQSVARYLKLARRDPTHRFTFAE